MVASHSSHLQLTCSSSSSSARPQHGSGGKYDVRPTSVHMDAVIGSLYVHLSGEEIGLTTSVADLDMSLHVDGPLIDG